MHLIKHSSKKSTKATSTLDDQMPFNENLNSNNGGQHTFYGKTIFYQCAFPSQPKISQLPMGLLQQVKYKQSDLIHTGAKFSDFSS